MSKKVPPLFPSNSLVKERAKSPQSRRGSSVHGAVGSTTSPQTSSKRSNTHNDADTTSNGPSSAASVEMGRGFLDGGREGGGLMSPDNQSPHGSDTSVSRGSSGRDVVANYALSPDYCELTQANVNLSDALSPQENKNAPNEVNTIDGDGDEGPMNKVNAGSRGKRTMDGAAELDPFLAHLGLGIGTSPNFTSPPELNGSGPMAATMPAIAGGRLAHVHDASSPPRVAVTAASGVAAVLPPHASLSPPPPPVVSIDPNTDAEGCGPLPSLGVGLRDFSFKKAVSKTNNKEKKGLNPYNSTEGAFAAAAAEPFFNTSNASNVPFGHTTQHSVSDKIQPRQNAPDCSLSFEQKQLNGGGGDPACAGTHNPNLNEDTPTNAREISNLLDFGPTPHGTNHAPNSVFGNVLSPRGASNTNGGSTSISNKNANSTYRRKQGNLLNNSSNTSIDTLRILQEGLARPDSLFTGAVNHSRTASKRINFSESVQVSLVPYEDEYDDDELGGGGEGDRHYSGSARGNVGAGGIVGSIFSRAFNSSLAIEGGGGGGASRGLISNNTSTSASYVKGAMGSSSATSLRKSAAIIPSLVPSKNASLSSAGPPKPQHPSPRLKSKGKRGQRFGSEGYQFTFSGNTVKRIAVDDGDDDDDEFSDDDDQTLFGKLTPQFCKPRVLSDGSSETVWARLKKYGRRCAYISYVFLRLSLTDANRRKSSFGLGLGSVVVVVFIAAVLFTTLNNMNIIFLKLGEADHGEMDLIVIPGGQVKEASSLNYTVVAEEFGTGELSFHSARIKGEQTKFINPWATRAAPGRCLFPPLEALPRERRDSATVASYLWLNSTQRWTREVTNVNECEGAECAAITVCPLSNSLVSGDVYWIDFDREKRMGLGRTFANPTRPLADDECVIDVSMARSLGVGVGDQFVAIVDASYPFMEAYQRAGLDDLSAVFETVRPDAQPAYTSNPVSFVTLRVHSIVTTSSGKLPKDDEYYVFADYRAATQHIGRGLSPEKTTAAQRDRFASVDPNTCANTIIFNFPPDIRNDKYVGNGYEGARSYGLDLAERIVNPIGFNQVSCSMPLVGFLYNYRFFSMFLSLLIWLIIAALAFLSVVLIYSLLTINIESRTYELGVMRMEGFPRHTLTGLVIVGALVFAIPGCIIGLVLGQCAYLGMRALLQSLTETEMTTLLSGSAVGWAVLAGLGIPLLASLAPVASILTQSLPEALNTERGRTKAVDYNIEGASDSYFSWSIVGLGTVLSVFGFLIYYLFPKSLLNSDLSLLLIIFFSVLIMMLTGLILLTLNFERFVGTMVQYVFLFWEHNAIFLLVERNLTAHRLRNRKPTLMFALSLGFIIFISVAFDIQFISITYNDERRIGGDILIGTKGLGFDSFSQIDGYLQWMIGEGLVEKYAYNTGALEGQPGVVSTTLQTVGRFKDVEPIIRGVSPNFFESTDDKYLIIHKQDTSSGLSLGERLYTLKGSATTILPTTFEDSLALDKLEEVYELYVSGEERDILGRPTGKVATTRTPLATTAFIDAAPVLTFSKFPQGSLLGDGALLGGGAGGVDCVMSIPALVFRSQGALRSVRDLRWNDISISTFKNERKAAIVTATLKGFTNGLGDFTGYVSNLHEQSTSFDSAKNILNFFFYFTQIMATAICFFALLSSMSTNILHQAKEIGVLRCLGLKVFATYRIYLWESFVIVLSASLMGLVVGTIVAYTMLLQNSLFTQLPLPFAFPLVQLGIVVGTSVFCAFFASYGPVRALLSLPSITHIVRRSI